LTVRSPSVTAPASAAEAIRGRYKKCGSPPTTNIAQSTSTP
jgi:hypothetical protein